MRAATLLGRLAFALLALLAYTQVASAQTVYKWIDDRGVVHFSDVPPTGVPNVEELQPPTEQPGEKAPPPGGRGLPGGGGVQRGGGVQGGAPQPANDQPQTGGSGEPSRYRGEAKVILTSREVSPRGAQTRHVIGGVKNVGGRTAREVGVTLHISDTEGECGREEAEVAPSSLEPGEEGHFDSTVDSRCFLYEGTVDAEPHWR